MEIAFELMSDCTNDDLLGVMDFEQRNVTRPTKWNDELTRAQQYPDPLSGC